MRLGCHRDRLRRARARRRLGAAAPRWTTTARYRPAHRPAAPKVVFPFSLPQDAQRSRRDHLARRRARSAGAPAGRARRSTSRRCTRTTSCRCRGRSGAATGSSGRSRRRSTTRRPDRRRARRRRGRGVSARRTPASSLGGADAARRPAVARRDRRRLHRRRRHRQHRGRPAAVSRSCCARSAITRARSARRSASRSAPLRSPRWTVGMDFRADSIILWAQAGDGLRALDHQQRPSFPTRTLGPGRLRAAARRRAQRQQPRVRDVDRRAAAGRRGRGDDLPRALRRQRHVRRAATRSTTLHRARRSSG